METYSLLNATYGFDIQQVSLYLKKSPIRQVHGSTILNLDSLSPPSSLLHSPQQADGVISTQPKKTIHIATADCLPILLFNPTLSKIGALHCGWRGALQGIFSKAIKEHFSTQTTTYIILGPHLRSCCFEVKEDFIQLFKKKYGKKNITYYITQSSQGSFYFNMIHYLEKEDGLFQNHHTIIDTHALCTMCSDKKLPSYRREKTTTPEQKKENPLRLISSINFL